MNPHFMAPPDMPAEIKLESMLYTQFLLIYLDADGQIRVKTSGSIADSFPAILSMKVMDVFMEAIDVSKEVCVSNEQVKHGMPMSPTQATMAMAKNLSPSSQITQNPYVGMNLGDEGHMENPVLAATPFQPAVWPVGKHPGLFLPTKGPRYECQELCNEEVKNRFAKEAMISVEDRDILALYYKKAFENLQQTNCRTLAKAYVKLVEPRKQVNYPYNGRKIVAGTLRQLDPSMTKPPWWPSEVSHREPDHLPKAERIRLLVYILRELRISHGISAAKLKEVDQPIRHQICPPERLQILDELYQVRQQEEQFLDGKTSRRSEESLVIHAVNISPADGPTMAWISRANLPKTEGTAGATHGSGKGSGNSSSTDPVTVRDTETSIGGWGYACAMDAPQTVFTPRGDFANATSNHHALLSQIDKSEPPEQILPYLPKFDSIVSVSPHHLKRKRDVVGFHPAKPRSPNTLTHYFPPPPNPSQSLSTNIYGPAYPIQSPVVPGFRHSMRGVLKEPFEAYAAPY